MALVVAAMAAAGCAGGPPPRWEGTPSPAPSPPVASAAPTATPLPAPDPTQPPDPTILGELLAEQGHGSWLSGRFTVDTSWQLEWRHDSHRLFTLDLVPAGADVFGQSIVNVAGSSRGLQPMYEPGQYRIRIRSAGSWSIRVVDLDHAPHLLLPAELSGTAPTNTPVFEPDGAWLVEWQADELELQLATADLTQSWSLTTRASRSGCATSIAGGALFIHVVSNRPWAIAIRPRAGEMVCPVG